MLKYEDFIKLTKDEQTKQYDKLSDVDKAKARKNMQLGYECVGHDEHITEEQKEWLNKLN